MIYVYEGPSPSGKIALGIKNHRRQVLPDECFRCADINERLVGGAFYSQHFTPSEIMRYIFKRNWVYMGMDDYLIFEINRCENYRKALVAARYDAFSEEDRLIGTRKNGRIFAFADYTEEQIEQAIEERLIPLSVRLNEK